MVNMREYGAKGVWGRGGRQRECGQRGKGQRHWQEQEPAKGSPGRVGGMPGECNVLEAKGRLQRGVTSLLSAPGEWAPTTGFGQIISTRALIGVVGMQMERNR